MGDSRRFFWKMVSMSLLWLALGSSKALCNFWPHASDTIPYWPIISHQGVNSTCWAAACHCLAGIKQVVAALPLTGEVSEGRVLHHPAQAQKSISACRPHKPSLMMDPMPLEVLTCLDNVCLLWKKNRVVNWVFAEGQKCLLRSGQAHEEWHKPHPSGSISDIVRKGIVSNLAQARAVCGDSCWTSCCNLVSGSSKVLNLIPCVFTLSTPCTPTLFWSLLSHSTNPQLVHDCVCRSLPSQVPCVSQWILALLGWLPSL